MPNLFAPKIALAIGCRRGPALCSLCNSVIGEPDDHKSRLMLVVLGDGQQPVCTTCGLERDEVTTQAFMRVPQGAK